MKYQTSSLILCRSKSDFIQGIFPEVKVYSSRTPGWLRIFVCLHGLDWFVIHMIAIEVLTRSTHDFFDITIYFILNSCTIRYYIFPTSISHLVYIQYIIEYTHDFFDVLIYLLYSYQYVFWLSDHFSGLDKYYPQDSHSSFDLIHTWFLWSSTYLHINKLIISL
jgi:hypothetical protein